MFATVLAQAQVTGTKTIPGDYATLAAAIADLNATGVGAGGATINLTIPETAPTSGYLLGSATLNASTSAANPLVINGGNNLITAYAGGTSAGGTTVLPDAVFRLAGTDFVTLNQLNIVENPLNTTPTAQMEVGILVRQLTSADGVKNLIISNCTVNLNGPNTGITTASGPYETGIAVQNVPIAQAISPVSLTAVTPSGVSGLNENITIRGCTINNCYNGISVIGNSTVANYTPNVMIGGDGPGEGNTITNTGVNTAGITTTHYGIYNYYCNSVSIVGNNWTSTPLTTSAMYGIATFTHVGHVRVAKNTLTGTNSLALSSLFYVCYVNSGTNALLLSSKVDSNTIQNCTHNGSGTFYMVWHQAWTASANPADNSTSWNVLNNNSRSQLGGTTWGVYSTASGAGGRQMINNQVTNFSQVKTSTNTSSVFLTYPTGSQPCIFRGNVVNNFTTSGAGTGTVTVYGIYSLLSANTHTIDSNRISNLNTGHGGTTHNVYGMFHSNSSGTINITRNNVHSLSIPSTSGTIDGIYSTGAATKNIINNFVSNLTCTNMNVDNAIKGINVLTSGVNNIYNNTIYLGSGGSITSSGLTFGVSGIVWTGSPTLDLRNNIVFVDAVPAGNGKVAALRTVDAGTNGVVPTPYAATSNNNVYHAPNNPNCFLYVQSAMNSAINNNAYNLTIDPSFNSSCGSLFKAFASPRESATFTESNLTNALNPNTFNPSGISYAKSGGQALVAVPLDYNGTARPTPPDMGALQFTGTALDAVGPSISFTAIPSPLGYCTGLPSINATITDLSGVNTASGTRPRIYYKKSTDANTFAGNTSGDNGWKWVEASNTSSPFIFNMNAALLQSAPVVGDIIQYFIVAQDMAAIPNLSLVSAALTSCPASVNLTALNFPTLALPAINQVVLAAPGAPMTLITSADPTTACLNGSVVLSVSDTVQGPNGLPAPLASYGAAAFTQLSEDEIFGVTINGTTLNSTSDCNTLAPGPGSVAQGYGNYTTSLLPNHTATLSAGTTYTGVLTLGDCSSISGTNSSAIFIDLNRNGVWDLPAETVWGVNTTTFTPGGTPNNFSFTIPGTAVAGQTIMRVKTDESSFTNTNPNGGSWGETEDYMIRIVNTSGLPNSAFNWTGGTFTGNPSKSVTATNITSTTTYTVTATDFGGCTATSTISVPMAVPIAISGVSGSTGYCANLGSTALTINTTGGSTPIKSIWTGGPVVTPNNTTVNAVGNQTGFTGLFAPANWTINHVNGGNGSVNAAGAPANIILTGPNGTGSNSYTYYQRTFAQAGTISFNWSVVHNDPTYDGFGYAINGINTQLTATSGSGFTSVPINAGDVFAFYGHSFDGCCGTFDATITNFSGPALTTVPAIMGATASVNPPVGNTTYTVTVYDACGTSASTTVNVSVGDTVNITSVPASAAICDPTGNVVMTANAVAGSFVWSPATGLSSTNTATTTATPATTTTYTVTSTANGCVSTATRTVIVTTGVSASITQSPLGPLCGVNPTLSAVATGGGSAGPPAPGARYYIRDADPWGSAAFNTGMNAVFGVGNWTSMTYAAATPATIFTPATQFVYLEGSANTEAGQTSYLAANLPLIESWVNAGGRLLINRGPNTGVNTNFGFGGVTNVYNSPQGTVNVDPMHPIVSGPFTPAGAGPYTGGSYSHAHITGPGITPIITGGGVNVLAEKQWGAGLVLFGGYTAPSFHSPTPNAQNLFQNWINYCANTALGVPYTYSWAPGGASTSSITANTSGTYTVTVGSPVGCPSGTATISINISAPVVITSLTQTPAAASCPGTTYTLTAVAPVATDFVWNPGNLTGASVQVTPMAPTTYTVTATETNSGCSSTSVVSISPLAAPTFSAASATPNELCSGDTTSLTAAATLVVGAPGPGAYTVSSITFAPVSPAGPTNAGPTGDDITSPTYPIGFPFTFYGNTYSNFVISTNGFISFVPGSPNGCCSGQNIPNAATPNDLIALAWSDLNTSFGGTIDYFNLTAPNRLVVRFNAVAEHSNASGTVTSQAILYENGTIEIHTTGINGFTTGRIITQGIENAAGTLASTTPGWNAVTGSPTMSNTATRFAQFTATPISDYAWSPAIAGGIANPLSQTTNAGVSAATVYTVTATGANTCTATSTVSVTLKPNITGTASATPAAVCIGGSTSLSGNVPVVCGPNVTGFTAYYAPANWTVVNQNSNGTANLAGAPASITFTTGTNNSFAEGRDIYSRVIGCSGTVSFNWNYTYADLSFDDRPRYRINSGAELDMPGFNSLLFNTPQNGTASIPVNAGDTLHLIAWTSDNVMPAATITISNFSAPAEPVQGNITFWDAPTGGNLIGSSPVSVTPASVGTATYYAQYNSTSSLACTNPVRDAVNVTVNALPQIFASATPAAICVGGSTTLSGFSIPTIAPGDFSWMPGSLVGGTQTVSPAATTVYTVTAADGNGCSNTGTVEVVVNPLPSVTASATPATICSGSTSVLNASVPGISTTYDFTGGFMGWTTGNEPFTQFSNVSIASTWAAQAHGNAANSLGTPNTGGLGSEHSWILSPVHTFGSSITLTFDSWSNNEGAPYDAEFVEYSTDGGTTWTNITGSLTPTGIQSLGNNATWINYSVTVPVTPTANGRIRFRYDTGDAFGGGSGINNGWYVDNVVISTVPAGTTFGWSGPATIANVSSANTNVTPGTTGALTYTVQVQDANGCTNTATTALTVTPNPTGNTLADPILSTLPLNTTGNNLSANCWTNTIGQSSPDVFYRFVMPSCNDSLVISTCIGSSYDTYIRLLDTLGNLIAFNDDACGAQSLLNVGGLTPGATYHVVVEGWSTSEGNYTLDVTSHQGNGLVVVSGSISPNTTCMNTVAVATGSSPTAVSYTWSGGVVNGDAFVVPMGLNTYTVTGTDANGCSATATAQVTGTPASGDLSQSSAGNTTSTVGNSSGNQTQPDGSSLNYYSGSCNLIAGIDDGAGGNVLGATIAQVNVNATVQTHNGQPYVNRWFQITPTSNGPAVVTFFLTQHDFDTYNTVATLGGWPLLPTGPLDATGIANLRVTKVDDAGFGNNPLVLTPTSVTWDAVNNYWTVVLSTPSFSQFYFHGQNPGNIPLPATITKFDGRKTENSNMLEWTTVSEQNNSHFVLQYATDGINFTDLARVDSKAPNGNSAQTLNYSFEHTSPAMGHNYYRLLQVDIDAKSTLNAKVVDLIWGTNGSTVSVYPNPTKGMLNIDLYTSRAQNTTVKVLDMSGRIVKQIQARSEAGVNKLTIDLSEVANGVYSIQVFENDVMTHVDRIRKND